MSDRNSYIFYRSFEEAIRTLSQKEEIKLRRAISDFSLDFKDPELTGLTKTIWNLMKPNLNANNQRFINGLKGAEHGKKGGRPITPTKPLDNPNQTPSLTPNKDVDKDKDVNVDGNYVYPISDALKNEGWIIQLQSFYNITPENFIKLFEEFSLKRPNLMSKEEYDDALVYFNNWLNGKKQKGQLGGEFQPEGRGKWIDRPDGSGKAWISFE